MRLDLHKQQANVASCLLSCINDILVSRRITCTCMRYRMTPACGFALSVVSEKNETDNCSLSPPIDDLLECDKVPRHRDEGCSSHNGNDARCFDPFVLAWQQCCLCMQYSFSPYREQDCTVPSEDGELDNRGKLVFTRRGTHSRRLPVFVDHCYKSTRVYSLFFLYYSELTDGEKAKGERRAFDGYELRDRGDFLQSIKEERAQMQKDEMDELLGVAKMAGIDVKPSSKFEDDLMDDGDYLDLSVPDEDDGSGDDAESITRMDEDTGAQGVW